MSKVECVKLAEGKNLSPLTVFGQKQFFKCQSRKVNVLELRMKQAEFNSIQIR